MNKPVNEDQKTFWSNAAGPKWLHFEAGLDHLMQPVLDGVFARADIQADDHVLDIGCGTGASAVQLGGLVKDRGRVLGADISGPMLARAATRAQDLDHVSFVEADAQEHRFEEATFDHLVSRFGVMFFGDPVAAFANMARALKSDGRVTFGSWGQIQSNPFFTFAAQAARTIIGAPPKVDPDLPGPFAFRDPARVLEILAQAGLHDAQCDTAEVMLTPRGNLADFADMVLSIGPSDAAITHFNADPDQVAALREMLQDIYAQFDGPEGLRIPAEINFFTARKA
ncbi:MAG: class I SAM-dependent methyltransferase [Sulfitobacter sp.]